MCVVTESSEVFYSISKRGKMLLAFRSADNNLDDYKQMTLSSTLEVFMSRPSVQIGWL
jgi:hypothetical protein